MQLDSWMRGLAMFTTCFALLVCGCQQKEKVLDVETPGGSIEIERDKTDGDIAIEVEDN